MQKNIRGLVDRLVRSPKYAGQVVHYRYLPPGPPDFQELDESWPEPLRQALAISGISRLFSHQVEAMEMLRRGEHTAVTTPTASGKTLIYNMVVCEKLLQDPNSRALYLFPLKALAQDQLKILEEFFKALKIPGLTAAVYDGDTPPSARARLKRNPPRVLFTNPDMLHYGMLAYAEGWMDFFRRISVIVIDEAHTYRGVFGSHVALILRRLQRLCGHPGPTLAASSATMANSKEFLRLLTGQEFNVIERCGAPRQGRHVVLVNPSGSPYHEAAKILCECLDHEIKTIVFTKSRKITELIHIWVKEAAPHYESRIAAYRSGYLPAERRIIEQRLFREELSAVISTSALESGIDVGGLDACVLVGYPGTMISTWQRVGRAGRQREALMVLIALPDALDHYFLNHPEVFFKARFENCVLDPDNHQILRQHFPCAAREAPLTREDAECFGSAAWQLLPGLVQEGLLTETVEADRWFSARKLPHRRIKIRSAGEQYVIKHADQGRVFGSIEESRVFKECHPGAIYLHAGLQYEVVGLELIEHTVLVRVASGDWYTQYTGSEEIEILDIPAGQVARTSAEWFTTGLAQVRVTEKVVAYERRRVRDQSLISEHKLQLPPRIFETQAVVITVPGIWRRRCGEYKMDFAGGLHAVEHTLIAALPIQVLCDRWDLGGVSTMAHPQLDQPAIVIYDGFSGGVGLAAKGLAVRKDWLSGAREIIAECACEEGCPACIHSPKCGSRNQSLDKPAGRMILEALARETISDLNFTSWSRSRIELPAERKEKNTITQPEATSHLPDQEFRLLVFDLETQKSAAEVGGWGNISRMGLSLGVVYDHSTGAYMTYREDKAGELIQHLLSADAVVGYNIERFDLTVLSPYSNHVNRIRTFDLAKDVWQRLGHRIALDKLAQSTLQRGKTAEGLQAIAWYREGNWEALEAYCRADVEITRDLFWFGWRYNYLLFERQGVPVKVPVAWRERFPTLIP
ncbi:DEAD/DEAH box helicase [bacterium]|nr:DEAD/DEAH box helicase [bacterium]